MTTSSERYEGDLLSAREAAARLGVQPETLYAYVSRGFIASRRVGPRRQSFFAAADLERLLVRGRRRRDAEVPIASALTLIREDGHAYRGRPALGLARRWSFERTAEWLWGAGEGPPPVWAAEPAALTAAREAQRALPAAAL